ncbi:MAG TPA: PEP-CTERM sorting domain-containing protein [Deltaproteobacteria bacterium]|nr:PEP-CTERM sorting domain-containing protein [Deltaproteobacteria bacterium]
MNLKIPVLSLFLSCVPVIGAHAAIVQFDDRSVFEANAGAVTLQDFEGFAAEVDAFEDAAFDFGDFSAFNGPNAFSGGDIGVPPAGGNFGSTNVIIGATFISAAVFELTFDSPISAIGFDAGELADQRSDRIIFDNAAGDVLTVFDPVDQLRFWGFISDTPFTTLTISQIGFSSGGGDGDGFTIDNLAYAVVPEPSTGLLFASGLAMLAARRRQGSQRRPTKGRSARAAKSPFEPGYARGSMRPSVHGWILSRGLDRGSRP